MNVLPKSVVFVDDNPVERGAMARAFPEMRIIGRHPYYLRRALLWAPETQVSNVTGESSRRTEMMQAQVQREMAKSAMSRADFLRDAAPAVELLEITSAEHPRFNRALELINKTNQFNTTGQRWKREECTRLLDGGGRIIAFDVEDRYTRYGLVGVVLITGMEINQWVMSCRILGYGIEEAVMAWIVGEMRTSDATGIRAPLIRTDTNTPCHDLFAKCGFTQDGDMWRLAASVVPASPDHVRIVGGEAPLTPKP